jgi:molybdopterin molybdotransferase
MLSYEAARAKVMEVIRARRCAPPPATETVEFAADPKKVLGRILAENIPADRNYPPFNRATRDGFAVRAADAAEVGAKLRLIGESRAGGPFDGTVEPGTCVHIMTGAAMPRGANTIVMVEDAQVEGETIVVGKPARASAHFVLEGQETRVGESVVKKGTRLGYAELAMAVQVGRSRLLVTKKPRVAILSTGDEIVPVDQPPKKFQIRNTNSISLAAQVELAGGEPLMLGNVPDDVGKLTAKIEEALDADILILTGGVSVGKYDHVEQVLRELACDFYFDAVAIRPGKPAVFWILQENSGIRLARQSGFDHGDFRIVRGAGDRTAQRLFAASASAFQGQARASDQRKTAARAFFAGARDLARRRADGRSNSLGRLR